MYDIERCSWFSGSRITAQNANFNTHPNVIPLHYFVIMFMQFYLLLFLYPMKDFQLYTMGFEHWHILWQMVVKPFDMCVTLKHMYIYIYELSVCVSMMMYCVVVCSCWYWVSTLILCIIIILTPHPLK